MREPVLLPFCALAAGVGLSRLAPFQPVEVYGITIGFVLLSLLAWWRGELLACYDGEPRHPVMVALRETIHRFSIPPRTFLALLLAFEQDQRVTRYDTFDRLLSYCNCSANPVGHLVLMLFEYVP